MFPKNFRAWKFQFEKYLSLNILRTLVFHVDAPSHSIARVVILSYLMKVFLNEQMTFKPWLWYFTPQKYCYNITNMWIFQYRTYKHVWWFSDQNRCKASAMFPTSCLKSDPLTFKNNLTLVMKFSKRKELT